MRDPERIKPFLEKFKELWLLSPDLRFGQLVYHIGRDMSRDIFNIEEKEWLVAIEKQINDRRYY